MTRIIGIVSGKGGVGKTTVATNLGSVLSSHFNKDVIIVDCNITTSHLGLFMGMYYCPINLNQVLKGEAEIQHAIYDHFSGVKVIPASLSLEELKGIDISNLTDTVKKLFGETEFVILDSAPGLGREASSTLNASDEIIFVTTPYIPSVTDVIRCHQVVEEIGAKPLGIILNMVTSDRHELKEREIEDLVKLPVLGSVPFDKNILRSLGAKVPVVLLNEKSPASREFFRIGGSIIGEEYIEKMGLFKRLKNLLFKPKISSELSLKEVEHQPEEEQNQDNV